MGRDRVPPSPPAAPVPIARFRVFALPRFRDKRISQPWIGADWPRNLLREGEPILKKASSGAHSMKPTTCSPLLAGAICLAAALAGSASGADRVKTADGTLEGTTISGSGIRVFKGIPFA